MYKEPIFTVSAICMDPLNIENEIRLLINNGIKNIHIDVMDGQFVPRIGMYPEQLNKIKEQFPEIEIDTHLLIDRPERFIDEFKSSDLIIVHQENNRNLYSSVTKIKKYNKKVGIGLNISTPISTIEDIMSDVDLIMLMGFNPGILNQPLWNGLYKKISNIKEKYPMTDIMIDGGVKMDTIVPLVNSGATHLVCGSSTVYKSSNVKENISKMKELFNAV